MTNIVLCRGSGTRLWPISRSLRPKQFVKLFLNKSLFQLTIERNSKVCDKQFIVSNQDQYFLALDQLEELNKTNNKYLLEPIGRNTAPAITLACMKLTKDEIVLVTLSDHLIKNEEEYEKVLKKVKELSLEDNLVTFGITPTYTETGFGYIESQNTYDVKAFHEKPDLKIATSYLEAGNYYWNSVMFMFKAGVFLDELKKHSPLIFEASQRALENLKEDDCTRIKYEDMLNIQEDSIDSSVMGKSTKVKVIPSNINWSDLGIFDSLYEELEKDENQNTKNENHISIDSRNNLIYGSEKKIATIEVEDLIVVDTGDALLISKKGSFSKVKKVVKKLKEEKSELQNIHLTGHRAWGTYTVLEESPGYKIKRIEVKPGKRLSLQKHFHRNEHWIVVTGTERETVQDRKFYVRPNESTYIKMGEIHRLENEGKVPIVLIEAQVGKYTGEDDIVRINDEFERKTL